MSFIYKLEIQKNQSQPKIASKLNSKPKITKIVKIKRLLLKLRKKIKTWIILFFHKKQQEEYSDVINIKTILKGIQDLQKMKKILFDNNQIKLFNNIPNPKLTLSKNSFLNFNLEMKELPNSIDERLTYFQGGISFLRSKE